MRGSLASQGSMMISEKGIEGITPDNDFINKLLSPETKFEGPNKKGPAKAFLSQLAHKADTRKTLADYLKDLRSVEGGDRQLTSWLKEEGFHTSLRSVSQALSEAKANDLLFWASRYHLFVHWSANRAHPWDSLPKSEAACAILEIGKLRNSDGEAVVLLDGKQVTDFSFTNGVFKTTAPIAWATPNGETASVNLSLQFSAFSGYGEPGFLASYLGVQAHGILWPAAGAPAPAIWPITPPMVSAKVNVATRDAAAAPGGMDSMAFFEGSYTLQPLSSKTPMKPLEVLISTSNGRPMVKVNGQALVAFNFDYNNVLAWREEAGCSAWLQFLVLPGGPVFVGKISHSAHDAIDVVGERAGQDSQIAPDSTLDNFVGQQVAAGLATAAVVVLGHIISVALELWGLKSDKKGRSRAALEALFEGYMELFTVIDHVNYATEDAFPYGADVRILDPSAGRGALDAQQDALEAAASAKAALAAAVENTEGVREAVAAKEVLEAAQKSSTAAWRAHSAGKAALVAEESAVSAANLARAARTQAALGAAMLAAQAYNQAKKAAGDAARAASEGTQLALEAVELSVQHFVAVRDYSRLKDMAEASAVAGQAVKAAEEAERAWEADVPEKRREALEAAQQAADYAQQTYKHLRLVHN
ncbi:hypothetical protein CVIRNUC_006020 [Coccomyxa viridis]|uniref:Uncharacterized protein n=1 Tax=Coccomyxa viridis TaxID=1274662 RepID=A0AAV1I9W7_9CHLO|nr:hypothetical protein CVIRNUC_006020 [Coccomyxa viridis]